MSKKFFERVLGSVFILSAVGCGSPDCEGVCEAQQACDDNGPVDCAGFCDEADRVASKTGCGGETDDVLSCQEGLDDICSSEGCESELFAFVGCLAAFCRDNPDDEDCR
ncbi:MAG: hypothetical protein AAGN82_24925 [Myxococcota bacterium]